MTVAERFLKYIAVDTTSDPSSETFRSFFRDFPQHQKPDRFCQYAG